MNTTACVYLDAHELIVLTALMQKGDKATMNLKCGGVATVDSEGASIETEVEVDVSEVEHEPRYNEGMD